MSLHFGRIYRRVDGSPMLLGLPVHLAVGLLLVACIGGMVANSISPWLAVTVAGSGAAAWVGAAFLFRKDRAALSLAALRLQYRIPSRFESYAPGSTSVTIVERTESSSSGRQR
jgi:hypothetical protein